MTRMTDTDIDFPRWLELQRIGKGWSQSELSRMAGISRQVVSDYEGYKRKYFDEAILKKIARALKIPTETIFRAAGLLDAKKDTDEWVEGMNYKIKLLSPEARAIAERLLDALIEEPQPPKKRGKT